MISLWTQNFMILLNMTDRRSDGRTEQWTDGATDGQRHWLIEMRWTHPKMQAKSAVLKPFYCRGTLCYGKIFMLSTQVRGAVKDKGVVIRKWNPPAV